MNDFTVLLDMDTVTYDLLTPWLDWYNNESGDDLTLAEIVSWDWDEFVLPGWGKKISDFLHIEGSFLNLKPFDGAVAAIEQVHGWGVRQLFASTVFTKTGSYEKQQAVERDFPFIGKKRVLTTGGEKAFNGDVLFDDAGHNRDVFKGLAVRVKLQPCPYIDEGRADFVMTDWSQYPSIVAQSILSK